MRREASAAFLLAAAGEAFAASGEGTILAPASVAAFLALALPRGGLAAAAWALLAAAQAVSALGAARRGDFASAIGAAAVAWGAAMALATTEPLAPLVAVAAGLAASGGAALVAGSIEAAAGGFVSSVGVSLALARSTRAPDELLEGQEPEQRTGSEGEEGEFPADG